MADIGIIGANGYIGRHVARTLFKKGHTIVLMDKDPESIDQHSNYHQIDLCRSDKFPQDLKKARHIFFLAGLTGTSIGQATNRNFIETNEIGLLNFLEFCRTEILQAKIIFPSSRLVYKGKKNCSLNEDHAKNFNTIYAVTKFAGEQFLKIYQNCFGLDYVIFRIGVPYGNMIDDKLSYGTLKLFMETAGNGEDLLIFGNGVQKRSFIHIEDLANIIILGAFDKRTDNDVFNISGPDILSIRQVAEKIAGKYGVSVISVPWPEMAEKIESGDTILDSTKLDNILNYNYKESFAKWLKKMKA
ncbi:MAG: NAD(P)-dependent oxidoreductase [Desulfobacteraceae bacterium]|jgi:UDP-glucose 4-epimerase|nr:NAD(P)-dependent oxidoreductase [Desulfobacteraceae bacterium]